jgi:hypothetical protein
LQEITLSLKKESVMPEHRPAPDAPDRAVDAVIDRILENLASPPDPEFLNRVRAEFRRRVPLHLRSYAAAALILESAGQGSRNAKKGGQKRQEEKSRNGRGDEKRRSPEKQQQGGRRQSESPEPRPEENRPRYTGEGTTVFFGMGKRQRLYPRVLLRILCEEGGLASEEIGDIRSFDNYSFADIAPEKAEALIAKLDGVEFRGRGIPVSKARKRGEPVEEQGGVSAEKRPEDSPEDREESAGAAPSYDEEPSPASESSSFDEEPIDDESADAGSSDDKALDEDLQDEEDQGDDSEEEPKN